MLSGLVSSGLTGPTRSRAARPFRQIMSRGCEIGVPSTFFQANSTMPGLVINDGSSGASSTWEYIRLRTAWGNITFTSWGGLLSIAGGPLTVASDFYINSTNHIGISSSSASTAVADTRLFRDAAGIFAQRNGVNAQTFRVYNTYTSSTSNEFLQIRGVASANFEIGPQNGSAGGTLRGLTIGGYALGSATITGWLQFRPNATTAALEAFYLGPIADSTAVGGNARGAGSVDFQMVRSTAAQVASSDYAFVVGTNNQLSTAQYQACVGDSNQLLNGNHQYVFGSSNTLSSAQQVLVCGAGNTVSGGFGIAIGDRNNLASNYGSVRGYFASSYLSTMRAVAQDGHAVVGDTQLIEVTNKAKTTSATPVSLSVAIPSGKMWVVTITVGGIKSDGSNTAGYIRKVTAKNIAGTVTVVSSTTVGTDNEDDAATDFAVTASGANMLLTVTGIAAETWRWHFAIYGVDIKYGT